MTDEKIRERLASGTTTKPGQLRVIYNDGSVALVKRPGGKVGRSFDRSWVSSRVEKLDLVRPRIVGGTWHGPEVWNCNREKDGPLTPKAIRALVFKLGLDPKFIRGGGDG